MLLICDCCCVHKKGRNKNSKKKKLKKMLTERLLFQEQHINNINLFHILLIWIKLLYCLPYNEEEVKIILLMGYIKILLIYLILI